MVANILSQMLEENPVVVGEVLMVSRDETILKTVKEGYMVDLYTKQFIDNVKAGLLSSGVELWNSLLFVGEQLIIPRYKTLRESLFQVAHNKLGHFGDKMYALLHYSYYWPNTCHNLINRYISSCVECQHNKSKTTNQQAPYISYLCQNAVLVWLH